MRFSVFYWSVRREIWENRFLVVAPVLVATLVLVSFAVGTLHLPHIIIAHQAMGKDDAAPPRGLPFGIAATATILTGILVGAFYCLGALYGERRDRSILFWKSLPVSDLETVLSKAAVVFLCLPAIIIAVTLLMQTAMFALTAVIVRVHGESLPTFWTQWAFFPMAVVQFYGLATLMLWQAPLYAWLLMVSAWARRAPFLWAVLPPIALCLAEKIAFDSANVASLLADRLAGSFDAAFDLQGHDFGAPILLAQLAPLKFLATPQLWVGLVFTGVFLAAASRTRRYRGPL